MSTKIWNNTLQICKILVKPRVLLWKGPASGWLRPKFYPGSSELVSWKLVCLWACEILLATEPTRFWKSCLAVETQILHQIPHECKQTDSFRIESISSPSKMSRLSIEAVVAIIGVLVTLPPSIIILWRMFRKRANLPKEVDEVRCDFPCI